MSISPANNTLAVLLRLMAFLFKRFSKYTKYLKSDQGWINFSIGIRTENNSIEQSIEFKDGDIRVRSTIPENIDTTIIFKNNKIFFKTLNLPPNEQSNLIIKSKMRIEGNLSYANLFAFLVSVLMEKKHRKLLNKIITNNRKSLQKEISKGNGNANGSKKDLHLSMVKRKENFMQGKPIDTGVACLTDPYLSTYSIEDFPRLSSFLDIHFSTKPEICPERPKHMTEWFKQNGFETNRKGEDWIPELRQAHAFRYMLGKKKPIIRKDDLIAGTTTSKEIGVVIYPDAHGTIIWGELLSVPYRELNPYDVAPETVSILHHEVFPYWTNRNFREWVRDEYNNPLSLKIDERFAVYFLWKSVAISHTIPDFPELLKLGTGGIIKKVKKEIKRAGSDTTKRATLESMVLCLEGLTLYSKNLAKQAELDAEDEDDPIRKKELKKLADICTRIPENPARTLDEAVNALWIAWVAIHLENTNAGMSPGRLDQWLQPFFASDMKKLKTKKKKEEYIRHAIELIGCLYMRCTDHLPLIPDVGNYLFGGSSSDQAITLGGVTPEGKDAVNDMTYIFLKVTEMLSIRDPNVNARFNSKKNSETYLKRLCEVNLITTATPSMHNDEIVMKSLGEFKYPRKHLNDWSATGCVEPTLSGRHLGHTNCMMMNMVAALEMTLNNGTHPLMDWKLGPDTGDVENGAFKKFEDVFKAFTRQYTFLIDKSIELNEMLGKAHQYIRPTPLLSSLIQGSIKKGRDITKGGALYNTSGAACIGLADVTDSLLAIKKLVYDDKKISLGDFKKAIDNNFKKYPEIHALATNRVPLFGSGSKEALAMANRLTKFNHDYYGAHTNYRGGKYTIGFWSMSNHVAFGSMTGALPSGRLSGKAFTPGLTPEPNASKNLLDNLRDVALLKPENMNNNIAFNVKIVPGASDTHEKVVDSMNNYVKTYFDLGGMQMQMNVVNSDVLKDAMLNPENYRNLIVRISGYNAYFVTLNRDMQIELIERAEYGI